MGLRPYQTQILGDVYQSQSRGNRRIMVQSATGSGKSVLFREIISHTIGRGGRTLLMAHREELITQAARHLENVGIYSGIIKAGYPSSPLLPCQVASVASLARREKPQADLVVIDEAHHATANTYKKILEYYPTAQIVGFSATPARLDGSGFKDLFDDLICGPTIAELIRDGYLSRYKYYAGPQIDTTGVRTTGGDYNLKQLAMAADKPKLLGDTVESWKRLAHGKQTIVFAVNVQHSKNVVESYRAEGIMAAHLDGTTPDEERRNILARFAEGEITVLSNCDIASEGFDLPAIECVQLLRPTKSLTLYLQQVGRGLRPSPGKEFATILDHTSNWQTHGLPEEDRIWTLEGVTRTRDQKKSLEKACKGCGAIVPIAAQECPECGYVFGGTKREIRQNRGVNLQEVSLPTNNIERLKYYLGFARQKGYAKGWVIHRFLAIPRLTLDDLREAAKLLDYKPGWAYVKFEELNKGKTDPLPI